MTRSTILTVLFVAIAALGFTPIASAHYDPVQGRWLERDPIGYADSANLMEYAKCTPVTKSDPSGLWIGLYHYYRYLNTPVGPFKGFDDPRYSDHDRLLRQLLWEFNANKAKFCGCIDKTAAAIPFLTAEMVKAWLIQESGGAGDKEAWKADPGQVNVPGDWTPEKEELGLTKPTARNQGTLETNLRAALMALCRKGFGTSYKATKGRRESATFDGWVKALERYNANQKLDANGQPHYKNYCECIVRRSEHPDEYVPIEIPK